MVQKPYVPHLTNSGRSWLEPQRICQEATTAVRDCRSSGQKRLIRGGCLESCHTAPLRPQWFPEARCTAYLRAMTLPTLFGKQRGKLLITGASGFIGGNLAIRASSNWDVYATYHQSAVTLKNVQRLLPMDVTNTKSVRSLFHDISPNVVVHCAALANMNYCADHPDLAQKINVLGTANIASMCQEVGSQLIYLSTDMVFDGARGFYSEDDIPNPICVYGKTKFAGEKVVLSHSCDRSIIRVAWTLGVSTNESISFAEKMIARLQREIPVFLFTDEYRSPIYITSLCDAILKIAERQETSIFNLGGTDKISRYEFGLLVADIFGFRRDLVVGTTTKAFGFRDKRPQDCSLDSRRAANTLLTQVPLSVGLMEMARLYADASRFSP
jgi:dTDP-4-dehydrorhamnose reductase